MSFIKANASSTTELKSVTAPTAAVSQHAAYCFINGTLSTDDYSVKCPVGIKLTVGQLEGMPKLVEHLTNVANGTSELNPKFTFSTRVISGTDYRKVEMESVLADVQDPILKGILGAVVPAEESEYYSLLHPLMQLRTPAGKPIKCFPPSFDVRREQLTAARMGELAIAHHMLVDKEVVFTPTSVTMATASEPVEEEEY